MAKLTPAEAAEKMRAIANKSNDDHESGHYEADELLKRIARENGFKSASLAYNGVRRWFA